MCSFCYFYISFVQKILTFFVSPCKREVVGFLPMPTCKTLTLFKSLSMLQWTQSYKRTKNCHISNLLGCSLKVLKI